MKIIKIRQVNRQTDKQTDGRTDRQKDKQTDEHSRQTDESDVVYDKIYSSRHIVSSLQISCHIFVLFLPFYAVIKV